MNVVLDGLFKQNTSYDYDDYVSEESGEEGSRAVWIPVLFSLVLVVGLLGNVLVLAALAQRKQLWSLTDTFILHLGVSDILLITMLPFWAVQTSQHLGWSCQIFCKICTAVLHINFFCGIFLMVCISLDHYLSTTRSYHLFSHRVPSLVHATCFAVWLISLLFTIPDFIFVGLKENQAGTTDCVHNYSESDKNWRWTSRLFHHILCFLVPTAILIACWACILLRHSSKSIFKQKRIMLILPLVVVFLLCWIPYNITLFVDTFRYHFKELHKKSSENPKGSLKTALTATSALGCIHACLRPLLYVLLCCNFRDRVLSFLRCTPFESKASLWELGVGEEAPHDQVQSEDELKRMTCVEDTVQSVES